ncbi:MAM and LDL-receptor class A domain-containing protein 1-like isoform X2 [Biomphalaria glabrata]|uniref:MAM and LDL-receptor class A domain-containing protein 1-like isoform X2 n=1 Tax=Biomphalaria glabrata TaxID=6526 RepID=A0A9W3BHM7_BIOGL|nr:MAM and LDL-receptor class A domain-containing protein 1-like isoform X2 [Biomphalaria glabrata]
MISLWILQILFSAFQFPMTDQCPKLNLPRGTVRMRNKIHARFTCDTGLQIFGDEFATCINGIWSDPPPFCFANNCTAPVLTDTNMRIETYFGGGLLQFNCAPGFVRDGPEKHLCDGQKWIPEPQTKCKAGINNKCDFEDGLCGWTDDYSDDFDWTRTKGDMHTKQTGPSFDHTKGDESESSDPKRQWKKARFLSPFYPKSLKTDKCFEFYYHMYGENVTTGFGSLEVFLRPQYAKTSSLGVRNRIFYKYGNQGDQWIRAYRVLPIQSKPFQIVFQFTMSTSWFQDTAIDDIRIDYCSNFAAPITDHVATAVTNPKPSSNKTAHPEEIFTTTAESRDYDALNVSKSNATNQAHVTLSGTSAKATTNMSSLAHVALSNTNTYFINKDNSFTLRTLTLLGLKIVISAVVGSVIYITANVFYSIPKRKNRMKNDMLTLPEKSNIK